MSYFDSREGGGGGKDSANKGEEVRYSIQDFVCSIFLSHDCSIKDRADLHDIKYTHYSLLHTVFRSIS